MSVTPNRRNDEAAASSTDRNAATQAAQRTKTTVPYRLIHVVTWILFAVVLVLLALKVLQIVIGDASERQENAFVAVAVATVGLALGFSLALARTRRGIERDLLECGAEDDPGDGRAVVWVAVGMLILAAFSGGGLIGHSGYFLDHPSDIIAMVSLLGTVLLSVSDGFTVRRLGRLSSSLVVRRRQGPRASVDDAVANGPSFAWRSMGFQPWETAGNPVARGRGPLAAHQHTEVRAVRPWPTPSSRTFCAFMTPGVVGACTHRVHPPARGTRSGVDASGTSMPGQEASGRTQNVEPTDFVPIEEQADSRRDSNEPDQS